MKIRKTTILLLVTDILLVSLAFGHEIRSWASIKRHYAISVVEDFLLRNEKPGDSDKAFFKELYLLERENPALKPDPNAKDDAWTPKEASERYLKAANSVRDFLKKNEGRRMATGKVLKYESYALLETYVMYIHSYGVVGECGKVNEYEREFIRIAKSDFQIIDMMRWIVLDKKTDPAAYLYFRQSYLDDVGGAQGAYLCAVDSEIEKLFSRDFRFSTYRTDPENPR